MNKISPRFALSAGGAKHEYLAQTLKSSGYEVVFTSEDEVKNDFIYITPRLQNPKDFYDKGSKAIEYLYREDFKKSNGILTAEAAIQVAMENTDFAIAGCRALVSGSGAIAFPLARGLKALGATVTLAARNQAALEKARLEGFCTTELCFAGGEYDLVFNTVPAPVFDRVMLEGMGKNTLIIDLASLGGGVDKIAAAELGISVIPALALPGKYMPKTSAKVIFASVQNAIKEMIL